MDKTTALKNAIEYAKKNPDTPEATELRKRIESGVYNNELEQIKLQKQTEIKKASMPKPSTGMKGFAEGVGQSVLKAVKGAGQLGQKIGNLIVPKSMEMTPYSEENLQTSADKGGLGKLLINDTLEAKNTSQKIGQFTGDVAQFAIPGTAVSKATKGVSFLGKVIPRAVTSGTVGAIQEGGVGKEAGIAAATEVALPVVGKVVSPIAKVFGRLLKGTGSALSGASTDMLEQIAKNPDEAAKVVGEIKSKGLMGVLENNTKTIINGVSGIKKEARQMYGDALEGLAQTDIKPQVFRSKLQPVLDKYGSITEGGTRMLNNVEFESPMSLKKANDIINKISDTELNGKSLKKTLDFIKKQKYTTATGDERLAFNAFVKDIESNLKTAINESTDKLAEMNAKYSTDMGLAQSIEKIFGKVNFKNPSELNAVSQKLEGLFNQKGLSPQYVDDFLNRIGINPEKFKTSETIRQISTKKMGANTMGMSGGELLRTITSSGITPKAIRDIAIFTGKSEKVLKTLIEKTAPSARALLIKTLIGVTEE